MNKKEMNETIVRYAAAKKAENEAKAESKDLREDILTYFDEKGIDRFEAMGWVATVTIKKETKLNLDKVRAALGGEIPADFFEPTETILLNVKADKTAAGTGGKTTPKMAVVAA